MDPQEKAKALEELGGIPEEVYDDLLKDLVDQSNQDIRDMKSLLSEQDWTALSQKAHSIKGSSGNLRIMQVHEVAKDLESEAKEGQDAQKMGDYVDSLEKLIQQLQQDLGL